MIRLTGGEFRGRSVLTPSTLKVRPTQSRLRQALFNSLQTVIADASVLDLFAGSGALGFEALSRGAREVVFVEENRPTAKLIEKNAAHLGVIDRVRIITDSVDRVWSRLHSHPPFDLVLADPPYAEDWETWLLEKAPWNECLTPGGHFCLEWGTQKSKVAELPEKTTFLVKTREKNYGDSVLTTYLRQDLTGESQSAQEPPQS